jgi:hypothetical protein
LKTKILVALFAALMLSIAASCGGGGQEEGQQQREGQQGTQGQAGGDGQKADGRETVTGVLGAVDVENRRFRLRPQESRPAGGGETTGERESTGEKEPMTFRFNPEKLRVTMGGEELELEALKPGLPVKVVYVVRDDRNVARSVQIQQPRQQPAPTGAGARGERTG